MVAINSTFILNLKMSSTCDDNLQWYIRQSIKYDLNDRSIYNFFYLLVVDIIPCLILMKMFRPNKNVMKFEEAQINECLIKVAVNSESVISGTL